MYDIIDLMAFLLVQGMYMELYISYAALHTFLRKRGMLHILVIILWILRSKREGNLNVYFISDAIYNYLMHLIALFSPQILAFEYCD